MTLVGYIAFVDVLCIKRFGMCGRTSNNCNNHSSMGTPDPRGPLYIVLSWQYLGASLGQSLEKIGNSYFVDLTQGRRACNRRFFYSLIKVLLSLLPYPSLHFIGNTLLAVIWGNFCFGSGFASQGLRTIFSTMANPIPLSLLHAKFLFLHDGPSETDQLSW